MAGYATTEAFDENIVYDAFKKSSHGVGFEVDDIKHLFKKALESKLMIEEVLGEKRKYFMLSVR
eukprot:10711085-Ditylum_brightwellii.AAC.1